ncbi:unnamed protein product, partial [Closterium sp. NIES-53]
NVEETSPSSCADGGRHFSELATGSMFGEVAVLCNIPQPFDVSVIEFCQVLRLEREDLNTAINTFMVDGRKIVDNLLERTTETGSKYALLASEITSLIAQQEAELTMTTIYAASRGDIEHLKRLIKAGANAGKADYDGRTPLHLAAAGGYDEVVRFLLLEGAGVNSRDDYGTTPLLGALRADHLAAAGGHDEVVRFLLLEGADVNSLDKSGTKSLLEAPHLPHRSPTLSNPLPHLQHLAAAGGYDEVVRFLLEGADVNSLDNFGTTACVVIRG